MILLITTSKSLLMLDTETGQITPIHSGMGLYYGISFSDKEIYVAARHNDNPFDYLGKQGEEQSCLLVFNHRLRQTHQLTAPFPLTDMHQILYFDRKLWITCSQDNMIAIYDGYTWRQWYPEPEHKHADIHHFNSLWVQNNQLYILAHNLGREPSAIYRFAYPGLTLIDKIQLGAQAHNIWATDDREELFVCDSAGGEVISNQGKKITIGGFPRGVVITENDYFIGTSDIADRAERHLVNSEIYRFTGDWRVKNQYTINGHGQLLDIKAPGIADKANQPIKGPKLKI